MRLIDADKLLQQIELDSKGNEGQFGDEWQFMDTIKQQPTIDAVEVVRCKECIHFRKRMNAEFCKRHTGILSWNGEAYCSYGERKE